MEDDKKHNDRDVEDEKILKDRDNNEKKHRDRDVEDEKKQKDKNDDEKKLRSMYEKSSTFLNYSHGFEPN